MQFQIRKRRSIRRFVHLNAQVVFAHETGNQKSFAIRLLQRICILVAIVFGMHHPLSAQSAQTSGSSSRQSRDMAAQLIPFSQLNEATRTKISEVVESASLYRRLPVNSIAADPDYFRFLIRYPEVIVNIWQLMGVTQMTTERTGPFTIDTNDGAGTISTLDLVYGNENLHVFFGTGTYEGPVFKRKLNGRCVLVLRTEYRNDALGNELVVNQMDVFLKLDNVGASLMAKTIQPIVGPTADQNFLDSLKFIQRLNETTVDNGPGVQHMAGRLNIDEETRQKFIEAAGNCYATARSKLDNGPQKSPSVPSLTGNPNQALSTSRIGNGQVGTAGYSFQAEVSPTGLEYPIPAFQPASTQAEPVDRRDAFSRHSFSRQ